MIEERKRMMHYQSHSRDNSSQRSRTPSYDDADDDDEDYNGHDNSVNKRRIKKKKKPQQQTQQQQKDQNQTSQDEEDDENRTFDNLRRRLSSATMTSGEEDINGDDDYLGCSFKTVIHRPTAHFYVPTSDSLPAPAPPPQTLPPPSTQTIALTPSPLMPAPSIPLLVIPSPPAPVPPPINLPMHHRAHTDTDLRYYNQRTTQPIFYPTNWYPPLLPGFIYAPVPPLPPPGAVAAPVSATGLPPQPPPFIMQEVPFRRSSADCRRTANNVNEPHVIHPERVW